jgi:ParB family chromosome partitioning protein
MSRGLLPADMTGEPPDEIQQLSAGVRKDGGEVLGAYREPLAGRWLVLAALPLSQVAPTPFQRDLSETHKKRLTDAIEKVGWFLDPIIATREGEKQYWTPNGNHRRAALEQLGSKSITALLVPDRDVAFKILALNTEKTHSTKEKAMEVIAMERALAVDSDKPEKAFDLEFEEPVLLTLGICYEQNGRFAGSSYRPALKRVESFLDTSLPKALALREARAKSLIALDAVVTEIIGKLKARGLQSPYLRSFVTARINPIRFAKETDLTPEELIKKMHAAAEKFDVSKVKQEQLASAGGYAAEGEDS